MPAEVFDDALEITIGILEARMPQSASDPGYPHPRLSLTDRFEARTFRAVVLENELIRVQILPDLGGRISGLLDKRTGIEIIPLPGRVLARTGGNRGVELPWGVEFGLCGAARLNALGTVDFAGQPPADDESEAALWIADATGECGLGLHLRFSIAPGRAEIRVEGRVFNRTLRPLPYEGLWRAHVPQGLVVPTTHGGFIYSPNNEGGLLIVSEDEWIESVRMEDECLVVGRDIAVLHGRQLDSFQHRIIPFSGLGASLDRLAVNREAAIHLTREYVRVQTVADRAGHKLVLLTENGSSMEAPTDLLAAQILEIPLEGLPSPASAVALLDPQKHEVLRTGQTQKPETAFVTESPTPDLDVRSLPTLSLSRLTSSVSRRHLAHTVLGQRALATRKYAMAEDEFERALLFNGEDHLNWWMKSLAARLRHGPGDERPELLNAHYLAPLEPALRAEAFLAQDQNMGKEPSPLLKPLEENPASFVEVAAMLVEAGVDDQATRWIDEALRHQDLAMLRYLQAFCFLRGSRMHVEAAECVAAAGRLGFGPPFPWRQIEWEALRAVSERFPQDPVLTQFWGLRANP